MTTAEQFRDAVVRPAATVSIAGVPWPAYKVAALLVGLLVFVVVGVAAGAVSPAVLAGSGTATLVWLVLGHLQTSHR